MKASQWCLSFALALSIEAHGAVPTNAEEFSTAISELSANYIKSGGTPKALEQFRCFLSQHGTKRFRPKPVQEELLQKRCNAKAEIFISNFRAAAIIDYTQFSNRPRMYIFDVERGWLRTLHVGHGRYGNTHRKNQVFSDEPKRNSVLRAGHFSNDVGSNASAGGFFLSGVEYSGTYGNSLPLHGLEGEVNDNACQRATVIHKSTMITESSTERMSSGCPIVAQSQIDYVTQKLGEGALLYIYTPAEANLPEGSCGRNLPD